MRPEDTPGRSDLPTVRVHARAYFDLVRGGKDDRIRSLVALDVPMDPGEDLQPIARAHLHHAGELVEATYLGFDGAAYLPAAAKPVRFAGGSKLLVASKTRPDEQILELSALTAMHPAEETLAELPHHRFSGRMRDRWRTEFRDEQVIGERGHEIDLEALRPTIAEVQAAASRLLLVRNGEVHVRTPLPFWTVPYRNIGPQPQLVIPRTGDVERGISAFAHDRLAEALAFADLSSVKGQRRPGPPEGALEVEAGWRSGDDLSWVAQELGRYWLRNLDPVVHELSADGVRAWHHAVNAPGTLRSGDRQEARIILAGVLALREEIARTPSLEPYGFWLDKTRALADRLVHIEGMNPSLKPATPIVM
jgi:hypothetical protein